MKRILTNIQDFGDDDEDSDEDDEKAKLKNYKKISAIIFLIDGKKKMLISSDEEKSPFLQCLECTRNSIRKRIFNLEKCFCSIILLGTKKSDNPLNLDNITVVQEFKLLGTEHIMKIDEIVKAVDDSAYENEYGCDNFSLGDALWLSCHIFNERSKEHNKTLILYTNDDSPVSNDKNDYNRAIAQAQDMQKHLISFELIPLGENFDIHKYYEKIVRNANPYTNFSLPNPVTSINDMFKRIGKTNFYHVSLVKLPFVISDDFVIGVSVHFLVKKAKIPFKVKLSKSTNERVITKTQIFEAESGSLVEKNDIIKSQLVQNRNVNFTLSELKTISNFGKKELRLLGFKPASTVTLENFVRPCAFIYPDDTVFKGSSVFFLALLKRCIARQVVAICTFQPRMYSSSRFVALFGQDELLRHDETQELPPGFVVFFLPFAEEIRSFEDKPTKKAQPEDVELAAKLVKKLKFHYKPECFQNPKLKTHWAAIEALAFNLTETEEVNDSTLPNYELISRRTEKIAKEFMESVYEDGYSPEYFAPPKKSRPAQTNVQANVEDVENIIREGKGNLLSNEVLKNYLTSINQGKGISKMKKADLLEKIKDHLNLNK